MILKTKMHLLPLIYYLYFGFLTYVVTYPITYDDARGTPYKVGYDHRSITINGIRTMLICGAIHYPRSTPGMWPYIMKNGFQINLLITETFFAFYSTRDNCNER